jgi:hypothetical protein
MVSLSVLFCVTIGIAMRSNGGGKLQICALWCVCRLVHIISYYESLILIILHGILFSPASSVFLHFRQQISLPQQRTSRRPTLGRLLLLGWPIQLLRLMYTVTSTRGTHLQSPI